MYYSEEKRGARFTVLADLYALVNVLSQSVYVRTDTGEIDFRKEAAAEILESALQKGSMDDKTVTAILLGLSSQVQDFMEENFLWSFPSQRFARTTV